MVLARADIRIGCARYVFLFIAVDWRTRVAYRARIQANSIRPQARVDNAGRRDSDRHFPKHTLGKFSRGERNTFPGGSNQQSLEMEMFTS